MKNFKLYVYIGGVATLVTNSMSLSAAATYEETCSISENDQTSFSCKIAQYINPNQLNLYFRYFYPNSKLKLELYDYNGILEDSFDLIIESCSPSFSHDNQILSISAKDYASSIFAKTGVNLTFEQTGNIYELATQLLGETGLNSYYKDTTKNLFSSENLIVPFQIYYDYLDTLYQKYFYSQEIWTSLLNQNLINDFDNQAMNKILNELQLEETLVLQLKRNAIFNKYYFASFDQQQWNIWVNTDYVTMADASLMNQYLEYIQKGLDNSTGCKWDANGLNVSSTSGYFTIDSDLSKGDYIFSCILPKSITEYSFTIEDTIISGKQEKSIIEIPFSITDENKIKISFNFISKEDSIVLKELNIHKDFVAVPGFWTVDKDCLNLFIEENIQEVPNYYIKNTLSLNSSNLYNGLIELCLLFDATVKFDYTKKVISFENKKDRVYRGMRFDPNYNINNYSRSASSSEFLTVMDVYGKEINDEQIAILGEIPLPLKNYLIQCMEHNFTDSSFEDYFENYSSNKYYEIGKQLLEQLGTGYTGDKDELIEYCIALDSIPNFENRIYNIEYFYLIGAISQASYERFNKIIQNDLRKVNIKLRIIGEQYNNAISTLTELQSQFEYYAKLINTTEREINIDNWNIDNLNTKMNDSTISDDLRKQYRTEIIGYINSLSTALENLTNYQNEFNNIIGYDGSKIDTVNDTLYNILLLLYGYKSSIDNGYWKKYKELKKTIEKLTNELNEKSNRVKQIDTLLSQDLSDSIKITLQTEKSGLVTYILSLYHQLGIDENIVHEYQVLYQQALDNHDALVKQSAPLLRLQEKAKNLDPETIENNINTIYRKYFIYKPNGTLFPNWGETDEDGHTGQYYWSVAQNLSEKKEEVQNSDLIVIIGDTLVQDPKDYMFSYNNELYYYISSRVIIMQDDYSLTLGSAYILLSDSEKEIVNNLLSNYSVKDFTEKYNQTATKIDSAIIGNAIVDCCAISVEDQKTASALNNLDLIAIEDKIAMQIYLEQYSQENITGEELFYNGAAATVDTSAADQAVISILSLVDEAIVDETAVGKISEIGRIMVNGNDEYTESITTISNQLLKDQANWSSLVSQYKTIAQEGNYTGYLILELTAYQKLLELYKQFSNEIKIGLNDYINEYNSGVNLYKEKDQILNNLKAQYGDFLIEGYYENSDATTDLELLQQAIISKNKLCYPQITYNIGVIDLSSLENYKFLKIHVGDKIKLADNLFLQYNPNYQDYLEITGISYTLRQPENTQLTINKQDLDSRLIQKLFLNMLKKK